MSGSAARACRRALLVALVASPLACAGDRGPGPDLIGLEGRDRDVLDATYPPGTLRTTVRAREAKPLVFSVNPCDFGTVEDDPALAAALAAFREAHPETVPSCDRVRLARTGWTTVVGGLAYYQDYVFYDDEDQVLTSYRTFLQRSGQ